jgi:hypothetical protein
MQSKSTTVAAYVASLPADRRAAINAVRDVIRANLDRDFEEGLQYGMIGYYLPHKVFPAGYHCDPRQPLPYAGLASQAGHMSIYLMGLYIHGGGDPRAESPDAKWFRQAWAKTGKKLDMGKSCVRFKKLEDISLEAIGGAIKRVDARKYVDEYLRLRGEHAARTSQAVAAKKTAAKAGSSPKKAPQAKTAAAGRKKS